MARVPQYDVSVSTTSTIRGLSNSSGVFLYCGWIKPANYTAGNTYWLTSLARTSMKNAASGELTFTLQGGTTDGVWTTSGASLGSTWLFVAFLYSNTGSQDHTLRVWTGTPTRAPSEVTLSNTAVLAGTVTTGTTFTYSTSATALVGNFLTVSTDNVSNATNLLPVTAAAVTQAEADLVRDLWILPFYIGNYAALPYGMASQGSVYESILSRNDFGGGNNVRINPSGWTYVTLGGTASDEREQRPALFTNATPHERMGGQQLLTRR